MFFAQGFRKMPCRLADNFERLDHGEDLLFVIGKLVESDAAHSLDGFIGGVHDIFEVVAGLQFAPHNGTTSERI